MRLAVAGSRDLVVAPEFLDQALRLFDLRDLRVISHGACPTGIDKCADQYAKLRRYPVVPFPPDFELGVPRCYHIRNAEMAAQNDRLLLIWDGESSGSLSARRAFASLGKTIHELVVRTVSRPTQEGLW